MANFNTAIPRILVWEGGYVHDPDDLGGETKHGITDKLDGEVDRMADIDGDGVGDVPIRELTQEQAKEIYRREFWDAMKGDEIKSQHVATILFDAYVNMGAGRLANPDKGIKERDGAIRMIQRIVGVKDDGIVGPKTLAAINAADEVSLYQKFKQARIDRYYYLAEIRPKNKKFLKGWLNRANSFPDLV